MEVKMPDTAGDLEALQSRIKRLESKTGWLTFFLFLWAGLTAAFAVSLLMTPPKRTISAQGFVLRDAAGRTRAVFGMGSAGNVTLALTDEAGVARASLAVASDGAPSLTLDDKEGARAVLGAMRLNTPGTWPGERAVQRRHASSLVLLHPAERVFWAAP
jgi:hypothetical protein